MDGLIYRDSTGNWEISCDICGEDQIFFTKHDGENWIEENGEICTECNKGWKMVPDTEYGGYKYIDRQKLNTVTDG